MQKTFEILPERLDTLETATRQAMENFSVKGLALAVIHGGALLYEGAFGLRDAERGLHFTPETHVEAASLTKPLFAYAVLQMVRRGELDLDRPLVTYPVPNPTEDPRGRQITARHVLTHSTGLPNWGMRPLSLAFAPGTGFSYSGEGFTYLQQVAEAISGKRLDHLLQEEALTPFGMEDAALIWTGPLNKTLAVPYDEEGRPEARRPHAWHRIGYYEPNAAFSLYCTIRDYPKFLIHGITADVQNRVLSTLHPAGPQISWGLGWGTFSGGLWHWGDNGGYKSFVIWNAEQQDGLVIHTNSFTGLSACRAIADHITDSDFAPVFAFIDTAE